MSFDPLEWLRTKVDFTIATSASALYDRMESQSSYALPGIYVPYDMSVRAHFVDCAQILDFVNSVGRGRILDFGPGDGWPSLLMAPMVYEVVGVDGSERRVRVCRDNAARMGIANASFVTVVPGEPLPFADSSFDGATAASSLEQTPDPTFMVSELLRVLKPGGRLRMSYESLSFYHGREKDLWLMASGAQEACVIIYDRDITEGRADHYCLVLSLEMGQMKDLLSSGGTAVGYATLTESALAELLPFVTGSSYWRGHHPSCSAWLRILGEVGFSSAEATHNGGTFASQLFDKLPEAQRPTTARGAYHLLAPIVDVVKGLGVSAESRPGRWDPWITAVK